MGFRVVGSGRRRSLAMERMEAVRWRSWADGALGAMYCGVGGRAWVMGSVVILWWFSGN